jgi:hypothetical protein
MNNSHPKIFYWGTFRKLFLLLGSLNDLLNSALSLSYLSSLNHS